MTKSDEAELQERASEPIPPNAIPAKTSPLDAKLEWCIAKLLENSEKLDAMMQRGEYADEEEEYERPKPKKAKPKKKKGRGKRLFQFVLIALGLYVAIMWGGEQMGWWTMNWYFF